MKTKEADYRQVVRLNSSPEQVFEALTTHISEWWGKQDLPADHIGSEFRVSWGQPWYQFRVEEFLPMKKVVWKCTDANQLIDGLEGVQKEWVGTRLHWELFQDAGDEIELRFMHEGLVKDFICYDFCSGTWDRFLLVELKSYLEKV